MTWHEPQNARSLVASKPCTLPAKAAPMGNTPSPSRSQSLVARTSGGRKHEVGDQDASPRAPRTRARRPPGAMSARRGSPGRLATRAWDLHGHHAVDVVQDDGHRSPPATIRRVRGRRRERGGTRVPRDGADPLRLRGDALAETQGSLLAGGARRAPGRRRRCGRGSPSKGSCGRATRGCAVGHRRRPGADGPPPRAARLRRSARRSLRARHRRGAPGADRRGARHRARSVGLHGRDLRRPARGPALRGAQLRLARRRSRRADDRRRRGPRHLVRSAARGRRDLERRGGRRLRRSARRGGSTSRPSARTTSRAPGSRRRARRPQCVRATGGSRCSRRSFRPAGCCRRRRSSPCSATCRRRPSGRPLRWRAAPRLDLLASGAGQDVAGGPGGNGWLRATLRLDDRGDGSLGLEVRRVDVPGAQWTGVRGIAALPLGNGFRYSSEIESRRARRPRRTGRRRGRGDCRPCRGDRSTDGRWRARSKRLRRRSSATRPTRSCTSRTPWAARPRARPRPGWQSGSR